MKRKNIKEKQSFVIPSKLKVSNSPSIKSRRNFLRTGLTAAIGLIAARNISGNSESSLATNTISGGESCIDYGRSFLCNTSEYNSSRFWIESKTTIIDLKAGNTTVYYQGASCKSENTFGEKDLFYKDNYDFLPIFGDGKVLIFRRRANQTHVGYRSISRMEEVWGANPVMYLPVPEVITELDTWEKIRDATAAGIPIVTSTEFINEETGLKAVIECPCKTMNISHQKKMYQIDTGPIAFPDLNKRYDIQIDCLNLAFIAFNKPDFADFVIEAPTPVIQEEKEIASIYHYSKLVTIKSKNKIFALGKV